MVGLIAVAWLLDRGLFDNDCVDDLRTAIRRIAIRRLAAGQLLSRGLSDSDWEEYRRRERDWITIGLTAIVCSSARVLSNSYPIAIQ